MKNIVITGANGFLGMNLVTHFTSLGMNVKALVRPNSNCDLLDPASCEICIFDDSIESLTSVLDVNSVVIHTASYYVAEHNTSDVEKLVESNVLFGLKLLEAMKVSGAYRIINIGTSWQSFEGTARRPVNLYAATKQAFEDLLSYYCDSENFSAISIRLYDTYGETDNRMKLIKLLLTTGINKKTISMSPGEQLLDLIHISDVCKAIDSLLPTLVDSNYFKALNLSSGFRLTLRELVTLIEKECGLEIKVDWGGRDYRRREVMLPVSSDDVLGWRPSVSIETGIASTFNYLKSTSK